MVRWKCQAVTGWRRCLIRRERRSQCIPERREPAGAGHCPAPASDVELENEREQQSKVRKVTQAEPGLEVCDLVLDQRNLDPTHQRDPEFVVAILARDERRRRAAVEAEATVFGDQARDEVDIEVDRGNVPKAHMNGRDDPEYPDRFAEGILHSEHELVGIESDATLDAEAEARLRGRCGLRGWLRL